MCKKIANKIFIKRQMKLKTNNKHIEECLVSSHVLKMSTNYFSVHFLLDIRF